MDMVRIEVEFFVEVYNNINNLFVYCVFDVLLDFLFCLKFSEILFEVVVVKEDEEGGRLLFGKFEFYFVLFLSDIVVVVNGEFVRCLNFVMEVDCGDVGV